MENLQELAEGIYKTNVELGWYNMERSDELMLFLIRSEVFEAFEAWRKGSLTIYTNEALEVIGQHEDEVFKVLFEDNIKDSVQDEMADTCIRLLDFAGYKKLHLDSDKCSVKGINKFAGHFSTYNQLDSILFNLLSSEDLNGEVLRCFRVIVNYCEHHNYDLETHMSLKLRYNQIRGITKQV